MKYAIGMDLGGMIYSYIPVFIKIGPGIQKLMWGILRHTDSMGTA
jgi:hypothetical protein